MTIQTLNVTIGCGLVQLSKSNKNIGARWRVAEVESNELHLLALL